MYKRFLLILLPVLFLYSCKKEGDTYSPQVAVSIPYENQLFTVDEPIHIMAHVCDDRKLEYITVKLLDDGYSAVSASQTFIPENNCADINLEITIDNTLLPSGTYYVLVSASDGVNTTNEFRKIIIQELEKKLKFIIVLTQHGGDVTINKIDSLGNISQIQTITSDYGGSDVSSDAQQFYIAGRYTGDVSVYDIKEWQLQWNVPVIVSPPFPYFEAIDVHNRNLYVSYRQGKFSIFNETGSAIASRVIENGAFPLIFLPFKDYLITYEVSPDGLQKHLVAYFMPSLYIYKKTLINYDILKIFPLQDNECLLFCNNANQGVINLFSLATGDVTNKYNFTNGTFTDVACINPLQYLFLSGDIVWYFNYDYKGFTSWANAQNPRCLVYDETEGCYYFSENYVTVRKNRFWPNQAVTQYDFQDTVIDILPVYNRD